MERKRVVITDVVASSAGLLGPFVAERLDRRTGVARLRSQGREYNFQETQAIFRMNKDARPDIVIPLAALGSGIGANWANPGKFL